MISGRKISGDYRNSLRRALLAVSYRIFRSSHAPLVNLIGPCIDFIWNRTFTRLSFIRSMGLDPFSSASVSTPLDPNLLFSKADCPPVIDAEIKERVLRAHRKLIHMAIWARPDLAHCVSVLWRCVHNPSQKHLDAYLRVARYLIKTKDLRIVYGTHDTHWRVLYGFSDSNYWGADPDSYRSTGAYIFFFDGAACSWKVKPTFRFGTLLLWYLGFSSFWYFGSSTPYV